MTRKEWEALAEARDLLCLGDAATLGEMKRSFHRLSKKYHPDLRGDDESAREKMYRITAAYELLMRYVEEYRYPLAPTGAEEPEDWWMDRFGQDPLWGKGGGGGGKRGQGS